MKTGTVMVVSSSSKTRKGKGKKKATQATKVINKKEKTAVKGKCFNCGKDGHWKRNCKDYLSSLKKEPVGMMIVYEYFSIAYSSTLWILDSKATTYVCAFIQDLEQSRRLVDDEIVLKVANGARVAATTIGIVSLILSHGHSLVLNDCLCEPGVFKNIISIPILVKENYEFSFKNNVL